MRLGRPAVSYRRYFWPGTLMVSQGHTGLFYSLSLKVRPLCSCVIAYHGLYLQSVFLFSTLLPPSPINYVVSTLGSTDMLACENSRFSLLFKLHCFRYCVRMTDKRQKAKKVKFKRDESVTKQSIFVEYILL